MVQVVAFTHPYPATWHAVEMFSEWVEEYVLNCLLLQSSLKLTHEQRSQQELTRVQILVLFWPTRLRSHQFSCSFFRNWTCSNLDNSFCSFGARTNSRLAYTLSLYDRALMMVIRRWRKVLSNSLVYFSLDTEREMFLLFVFTGSGRTLRDGPLESSPIVHLLMEKFISSWTLVAELKVRDYCLNGWMNN